MDIFRKTAFRPLGRSAPQILQALETWPIRYNLAHLPPQREWGSPSKQKFNCKNFNFGLKLSVWASITSGLVGISSLNFSRRRDELWSTNKKLKRAYCPPEVHVHCKLAQVHTPRGSMVQFSESFASCHCCERNFDYLNWLSTRTCDAGRPQLGSALYFIFIMFHMLGNEIRWHSHISNIIFSLRSTPGLHWHWLCHPRFLPCSLL